jgi:Putative Flp pilus-assembly TadE/G-like
MIQYPDITASEALETNVLESKGFVLEPERNKAEKGQILILFALFLTAMLGILGLAMDVGYSSSQRRSMQNAADLSAQAGALAVASFNDANQVASMTAVQATINGNGTAQGAPVLERCDYIDGSNSAIFSCDQYVPSTAIGVTIQVRETHPTFFLKVVPGGPDTVTTRARAAARVELMRLAGMDGPFVVCGYNTKRMDGSEQDILLTDATVNENAIGKTFRLTGTSSGSTPQIAKCGLTGTNASGWRGLAENQYSAPNNQGRGNDQWWFGRLGTSPGAIQYTVTGVQGCRQLQAAPYGNCVMLLPVASDASGGDISHAARMASGRPNFYVVKVLGFLVSSCGAGCYQGTLLDDYPVWGVSENGWCRDCGGSVVIKLVDVT